MDCLKRVICILVILPIVLVSVPAQSGGTYQIRKSVIAGGGGPVTGGIFTLDGTIGQALAGGQSVGGVYELKSGYWPSDGPAGTPSPTATATPTSTPTASPTPGMVSGSVNYAIATKPVPGVILNAVGNSSVFTFTDLAGLYSLGGLGPGAYTVTPSRAQLQCGSSNGLFSLDAAIVAQFIVGLRTFDANQLAAAKVGGLDFVSSFDAGLIAQRVVGLCSNPNNQAGQWKFMPTARTYASISGNMAGENYTAIMMGDVDGDWNPTGSSRTPEATNDENAPQVSVPDTVGPSGSVINIPLSISKLAGRGVNAFQFDIEYDPEVIEPSEAAAGLVGTVSEGMSIAYNVPEPGLLKVAVFGAFPVSGDGVYADLAFFAKGSQGTTSPVTIREVRINETTGVSLINGSVTVTAANTLIQGKLATSSGDPIIRTVVTLTSSRGVRRITTSDSFGHFEFGSLEMGETYTIRVRSSRHIFLPITVSAVRSTTAVNLNAAL